MVLACSHWPLRRSWRTASAGGWPCRPGRALRHSSESSCTRKGLFYDMIIAFITVITMIGRMVMPIVMMHLYMYIYIFIHVIPQSWIGIVAHLTLRCLLHQSSGQKALQKATPQEHGSSTKWLGS